MFLTVNGVTFTSIFLVILLPSNVDTLIYVRPALTLVIVPSFETVAIDSSSEVHFNFIKPACCGTTSYITL